MPYVHGFTGCFFQTGLADFFAARDCGFYALDPRKCGHARRPAIILERFHGMEEKHV